MAKFYGAIGYVETQETSPGVWEEVCTQRYVYADVLRSNRRLQDGEHLNDNLTLNNQISMLSDPYALSHFQYIRYVKWAGANWKVTNVEIQPPRLILTIGGIYNGKQT